MSVSALIPRLPGLSGPSAEIKLLTSELLPKKRAKARTQKAKAYESHQLSYHSTTTTDNNRTSPPAHPLNPGLVVAAQYWLSDISRATEVRRRSPIASLGSFGHKLVRGRSDRLCFQASYARHHQNSRGRLHQNEVIDPPSILSCTHNVAHAALFRLRHQRETGAYGFIRAGPSGGTFKSTQFAIPHSSPGQEEMESNKRKATCWTITCFDPVQTANFLVAHRHDSSTAHASVVPV